MHLHPLLVLLILLILLLVESETNKDRDRGERGVSKKPPLFTAAELALLSTGSPLIPLGLGLG